MKTLPATYLFFACAVLAVLPGCSRHPPGGDAKPAGLTILGLDGATWDIIDHLIEKGELPGFRHLKETGSWGHLETQIPTESISIWTTIATGVSPSTHGVQTFTRRIPGTDRYVPSPGTDRQVPALWNMVSEKGKTVVSVKWFASWPAENVNGAILSPRLEAEDADPRTYPLELFHEIDSFRYKSIMDEFPQPPRPERAPELLLQHTGHVSETARNAPPMLIGQSEVDAKMFDDTSVWQAGKYVFDRYNPDLFMLYMKSTDRVQHFLWGSHLEEDTDPVKKAEAESIYSWYRFYDDIILELLEDDTRVLMVVSDHGFHSLNSTKEPYFVWDIDFDLILEFTGYLSRSGKNTVWTQSKAYTYRAMPFDKAVLFRLNVTGREPEGSVPPKSVPTVLEKLATALGQIITANGKPLFSEIQASDNDASLYCRLSDNVTLDDMIHFNNQSLALRTIVIQKGLPRGIHTHAPPGIFAVCGPGIQQGVHVTGARITDVTPTALHILDLPVARDFDGRVFKPVFNPGWEPVEYISSYGSRKTSDELTVTEGDNRMLDELKALGYIQ
jgi:predicted AlkP superfamily phosphohydrolase/phosphomutase